MRDKLRPYNPEDDAPRSRSLHTACLINFYDAALADGLEVGMFALAICDHCSQALAEALDHAVLRNPQHYHYDRARERIAARAPNPARQRVVCQRYRCRKTARLQLLETRAPLCLDCGADAIRREELRRRPF